MEKTISTNQSGLIYCIFTIALKLSALPSLIFSYAGNDSYVACLIALIIDMLATFIVIGIIIKHPDKSFKQLITETFGKVISTIIHTLLVIYFLAKCVLVLQELHDYFIATLFEELNPVYFLIVLGLIILYSTFRNYRIIGRAIELIFWPTMFALFFTLIFPIEDMQIEKLLPIFEQGPYPIYKAISRTTFAFGDYMIFLPLMSNIKITQTSRKTLVLYTIGTVSFIFSFFVIFVGCFGKYAISQTLALGELPLHNTTPETIGKLEWLTISIWTIILLINAIILAHTCRQVFDNLFGINDKKWSCYTISAILILIVGMTYLQLETIIQIAITPIFSALSGGLQLTILVMLIVSSIVATNRQKNKQPHKPIIRRNLDAKYNR